MYDIALYGHLVLDSINDDGKTHHEVGGIINVWKSLKYIDPKLNIYVCPTNIGSSNIFIDRKNSFRDCKSNLNELSIDVKIQYAKINLISYINFIDDLNFIQGLKGLICADVCSGKKYTLENTLDYLFVSEEDIYIVNESDYRNKIVIHSPIHSYIKNSNIKVNNDEYLQNINPLGAGDFFAAYYIYCLLNNKSDNDCLKESQIQTTKFLKDKNDKGNSR
jgi:hypothetical protein